VTSSAGRGLCRRGNSVAVGMRARKTPISRSQVARICRCPRDPTGPRTQTRRSSWRPPPRPPLAVSPATGDEGVAVRSWGKGARTEDVLFSFSKNGRLPGNGSGCPLQRTPRCVDMNICHRDDQKVREREREREREKKGNPGKRERKSFRCAPLLSSRGPRPRYVDSGGRLFPGARYCRYVDVFFFLFHRVAR